MRSILLVILSIFMLAGCGGNNQGDSIGTMEEPSRNENNQEAGPRDSSNGDVNENEEMVPSQEKNSIIGDDEFDMPDTEGHDKEKTGTND